MLVSASGACGWGGVGEREGVMGRFHPDAENASVHMDEETGCHDGMFWLVPPGCITLTRTRIPAPEVGPNYGLGF